MGAVKVEGFGRRTVERARELIEALDAASKSPSANLDGEEFGDAEDAVVDFVRELAANDCDFAEGLVREIAGLEAREVDPYTRGVLDGVEQFSYTSSEPWAENGVRYVGTTGMTLVRAREEILRERGYADVKADARV